jgi:hypothetical protein
MSFHFVEAIMVEIVVTGVLLFAYLAWFGLRREMRPDIYNRIVWWVVFGGAVTWFFLLVHSFVRLESPITFASTWGEISHAGCVATTMNPLIMIGVMCIGGVIAYLGFTKFDSGRFFKGVTAVGALVFLAMAGSLVHLAAVPPSRRSMLEQCYGESHAQAVANEAEREREREAEEARERSLSPGPMTAAIGPSVPTTYRRTR